jgi:PAS domain S-box-containing protein
MGIPNIFTLLKESLRFRIFSLLTLLILIISATFIIFHFTEESDSLRERAKVEGDLLARFLAYNSRIAVFAEHAEMLWEATDGILQNQNVISVDIFSSDGKLLIHRSKTDDTAKGVKSENFPALRPTISPLLEGRKKSLHREKPDYFEFYASVAAGSGYASPESLYFSDTPVAQPKRTIGIVRVILDKKKLNARLHSLLVTTFIMAVVFLLAGSAGAYVIARGLTRSLRSLMTGVTVLEQGNLSGRIVVNSNDELGKVSHAFNSMAKALEKRDQENRALEEHLRIARERLAKEEWERTFDTVPDQIAILDNENRITRINNAMSTLLDIGKEQAIGSPLFEHFDGTLHPPYSQEMSNSLAADRTYSTEIYKDKLDKFFFVTISPLHGENGRTGSVYVARDITTNKQAMETIRISEERFRIIAENINEVIWMTDLELKKILYVSPGYERIFRRSQQSLYDNPRSFIEAIHPEDRDRVLSGFQNEGRGQPFDHEYRIAWPDGTIRWIWDRGYPVLNEEGNVTYVTGVAEDITEKKQAEDEKKAIQAKLIQTNKMTSLGLLVSGLAHEVNNPNNSIKLAAHILSRSWEDIRPIMEKHYREEGDFMIGGQMFSLIKEIMPQHITGITANSRRIEGIIKNLRDFAQKGVANLNYPVDVNTVISLSASILNPQIKQYTRHFKVVLEEGLPTIKGNPQQLEQVVINLILNSLQALPDREKKVQVATLFDREADSVVILVKDEGEGMPKDVKERIFEPFFSTKLERGGSGLGLAISNFIIKEHKGSLEFESEIGRGTTAIITLPRHA